MTLDRRGHVNQVDAADRYELPVRAAFGAVADEALDRIAAVVQTVLGVPVGLVSLVDRDGQVFPGQAGLPEPWRQARCTPLTHSFCQYVVRSGEALVVADARLDPVLRSNLAIEDIGVIGYAGIPLVDLDGTVVGSLCAIDTQPHEWTAGEIALLTDLAAACSAELQLRSAAVAAREAQDRTRLLLELSETLSGTVTIDDISEVVGKVAIGRLGGTFGGIALLNDAMTELSYHELGALPAALQAACGSYRTDRQLPSSHVVAHRHPLYFDDLDQLAERFPDAAAVLATSDARSAAYLPLQVGERMLGTAAILWSQPRTHTTDERELLAGLTRYTAQALERALLLADRREVAEKLQAAMLPTLPGSSVAEIAARYFPARVADSVGGDWYDAFDVADGLALSVGDVEGHDIDAAAVMGQLRATLRGVAIAVPGSPGDTLAAIDRVLAQQATPRRATSILACLTGEAAGTALAWSNAGHLPPLLLSPGADPVFLESSPQLLLGTPFAPGARATDHAVLAPGATLLMFTDGLVERRQVDLDDSLADLVQSAGRHRHLPLEAMVDAVLGDLLVGPQDDDVVVLAVRTPDAR